MGTTHSAQVSMALALAYCATTPGCSYIDLNPVLVDANGHPRLELFRDDKLHYQTPAYVEFAAVIKPVLERLWREVETTRSAPVESSGENPSLP